MAFRIRRKRKDNQKAKQGNKVTPRNDNEKEKREELAEWDAIAESSRKSQRGQSSFDPDDEEP
ncbi:MAG TPA: hypothetical protein VJ742_07890 [Nitrososphaera sp.]|nr:hypothetical protein [Nitrososphaera sp.]